MAELVRAAILTGFNELAQALGLDAYRLLKGVRLHRCNLSDPDAWIPALPVFELLERSARTAGIEDFGLRLAAKRNLSHLGPIGLLVREEPTVRHAIRSFERFFRMNSESMVFTLDEEREVATLRLQVIAQTGNIRQTAEFAVGVAFRTLNTLSGSALNPESISFAHPKPTSRTIHHGFFKTPILFDNGFNGMVLPLRDLDARIPTADPTMARYIRRYLHEVVSESTVTFDATVRKLVFSLLPSGLCTSDLVARHLGIDRKTVNRRLQPHGQTFSSILDEVRTELARQHILAEHRSLGETAQLLGFAGLPTFSRWFQSRFGCSASAWRKQHQSGTATLRRQVRIQV